MLLSNIQNILHFHRTNMKPSITGEDVTGARREEEELLKMMHGKSSTGARCW